MTDRLTTAVTDAGKRGFVTSRTFDVPRELMFRVWTGPAHMQHWWGRRASRRCGTGWTCAPAVAITTARARLTATTCGASLCFAKS